MKIIEAAEFDDWWKTQNTQVNDAAVDAAVTEIINEVRQNGDAAVRRLSARFDKSSPEKPEIPLKFAEEAWESLKKTDADLAAALELAADHIRRFAIEQKKQFSDFEYPMADGLFTGQRVIPVERAAIYAPAGRFPLISTVLMGVIPAAVAGSAEILLLSAPLEDGVPDRRILAAAYLAFKTSACGAQKLRIFSVGGAQAIAALAFGTETIPRADLIAGPGNKYVAAAKRLLAGVVGIDLVAGPTDVLIITDDAQNADWAAADMLAQAEHDPDARARVLVNSREMAAAIQAALKRRLAHLPTAVSAKASLDAGGLIIVYDSKEQAIGIANIIAPEHLELQVQDGGAWVGRLKNYGSLFIGPLAVEALGDYSAGINHTLPTSGSARFSGGLSVRNFLKTVTTLRCEKAPGYADALAAAERIAKAEGLEAHAQSAQSRRPT
jgi:histidinol dehydrogenase